MSHDRERWTSNHKELPNPNRDPPSCRFPSCSLIAGESAGVSRHCVHGQLTAKHSSTPQNQTPSGNKERQRKDSLDQYPFPNNAAKQRERLDCEQCFYIYTIYRNTHSAWTVTITLTRQASTSNFGLSVYIPVDNLLCALRGGSKLQVSRVLTGVVCIVCAQALISPSMQSVLPYKLIIHDAKSYG